MADVKLRMAIALEAARLMYERVETEYFTAKRKAAKRLCRGTVMLENEGYQHDLERKAIVKFQESRVFTHIHVFDRFNFELTVYDEDKAHYVFKSSITGKAIERASIAELEELLTREHPEIDLD